VSSSPDRILSGPTGLEYLDAFQSHLHSIYEVDVPYAVSDFVTSDRDLMSALTRGDKDHLMEKLLLHQDGEDIDLSLYLHTDVIESLASLPLDSHLEPENLQNLCFAIEGISHFLYVIWRAIHRHNVSLLELELQAEVDKYIVLLSLIRYRKKHGLVGKLHHLLFEAIRFDESLSETEEYRYRRANHYAGKYCHRFERRYLAEFGSDRMFVELRDFYRLSENEKLRRIVNYPL